ncbi:MAG: acetylglutamate kinase [Anaerolineae bacterium]|nr:acetylglutamate kinase [Anaerolineae bacterium]MDQ7033505.1 acetylglutamate kinase [Anaerolineae bacterium]
MMKLKPILIKIGGHDIADPNFLSELASVIATMTVPVAIVHGGGKEISDMQQRLDIEPQYIDGVRITDAESLSVVTMVLCGTVNKRLVRTLTSNGVDAQGLSGVDRGIIRAAKMPHPSIDMKFTGEVIRVRDDVLLMMMAQGIVPVIAPICAGKDSSYNVNADHVAGAVAAAIGVERLVFITNVEGVLVNETVKLSMTQLETAALIADGTIFGGMIPKVTTALHTLQSGVAKAVITNLTGFKTHGGTVFIHS